MEFKIVLGADQALLDCINGLTAALVGQRVVSSPSELALKECTEVPNQMTIVLGETKAETEEVKEVAKRTRRTKEQMMEELQAEQKESVQIAEVFLQEAEEDLRQLKENLKEAEEVNPDTETFSDVTEEVQEVEETEEVPEITPERMRAQIIRLDELGKRDMVKAKLTEFGANKQSELTGKQRFDFYTALTKIK